MKIKMTKNLMVKGKSVFAGAEWETDDAFAKRLIAAGLALAVEVEKSEAKTEKSEAKGGKKAVAK